MRAGIHSGNDAFQAGRQVDPHLDRVGGYIRGRQHGDTGGVDPFVERGDLDCHARRGLDLCQLVLRDVGNDPHILGIEAGHQRGAGRDRFAHFHVAGGNHPRIRRRDHGVAAHRRGLTDPGARRACRRLGGTKLGRGAVECGLADEFLLKQLLLALIVGAGIGQRGIGLRHLRLAACHGGRQFLGRQPDDNRARLDVIARVEIDRRHAPGHLRRDGGLLDGLDDGLG